MQKNANQDIMLSMARKKDKKIGTAPVAVNKKAYHNFEFIDKYEAGVQLLGTEVKSLRQGAGELAGAYARIDGDECWLVGAKIALYEQGGIHNHEPLRKRKLLLHKSEIFKIKTKLEQRGFTLVPLKIYFNSRGLAKVQIAMAKGKRQYDKRRTIAERQQKRDLDRDMKKYR